MSHEPRKFCFLGQLGWTCGQARSALEAVLRTVMRKTRPEVKSESRKREGTKRRGSDALSWFVVFWCPPCLRGHCASRPDVVRILSRRTGDLLRGPRAVLGPGWAHLAGSLDGGWGSQVVTGENLGRVPVAFHLFPSASGGCHAQPGKGRKVLWFPDVPLTSGGECGLVGRRQRLDFGLSALRLLYESSPKSQAKVGLGKDPRGNLE